jgi:hypothetical protein
MPVSLLRVSRLKCSEQFWELKMAEGNTISEPAVDTRGMRKLGNVSQPTDPSDTKHYFFSLSSFIFPNFLSYFIFLLRRVLRACVYFSILLFIHPSAFRISFSLLACFISSSAGAIGSTLIFFHLSPASPTRQIYRTSRRLGVHPRPPQM